MDRVSRAHGETGRTTRLQGTTMVATRSMRHRTPRRSTFCLVTCCI